MAKPRVVLNSAGVKKLLNSDGIKRELRRLGERVEAAARNNAPVDTGKYRDSITLIDDTTDRVVVRIVAEDEKALLVESWSGNLAKALDAARE